jgi:hypothetical protein
MAMWQKVIEHSKAIGIESIGINSLAFVPTAETSLTASSATVRGWRNTELLCFRGWGSCSEKDRERYVQHVQQTCDK